MITFENVSLQYDARHTALRDINIQIGKGEFVFVVGPSGAGKSTFVRIITHELVPEQGTVFVNGLKINDLKQSKVPYYRRTLGIVFQDFRLLTEKTVFENIAFVLRVTGAKSAEIREKVNRVLDLVGLKGRANELPTKLSGGEQQRVAIARALTSGSELILADEPTGNLDSENSRNIVGILQGLAHEGNRCVIIVTHDPAVAEVADVLLKMKDGKLIH